MNSFETWFCGSSFWRWTTERKILPWMLRGAELGDYVLELGAGPGATTDALCKRAKHVAALEYDSAFARRLHERFCDSHVAVVQSDAAQLPFASGTFSSVVAMLVLHHLESLEAQESCLHEIYRVLRPGGAFVALEVADGWLPRFGHIKSTFVPIAADKITSRLESAGFTKVVVEKKRAAFRIVAIRRATP
jgi:ubiquinone/menaquinone biosynthesis C-methylase UbiE